MLLAIGLLFASAFGLRLYHIGEPPDDFHPIRQYRSALIARGFYFQAMESAPAWKRDLAVLNKEREGILEPPIMEYMATVGYFAFGEEKLWFPRALAALFWLIGGVFLCLISKKIASLEAAMFSAAYYLFLPFGIVGSTSFQPDSLMVMMMLCSIFAMLHYYDRPTNRRLAIAATVSSLAVFIKPVCLFIILAAFASLTVSRLGIKKALASTSSVAFVVGTLSFTAAYYGYGIFVAGFLRGQAQMSFLPQLLLGTFFWKSWLSLMMYVVGSTFLAGALLGVLVFREGLPRNLLVGLWSGYFIYGLVFTYHIHTHDYYQLPLIPVVALSLGPISAAIANNVVTYLGTTQRYWRVIAISVLLLALAVSASAVFLGVRKLQTEDTISPHSARYENKVETYQEIGEIVDYNSNALFSAPAHGKPLQYHGWLSGTWWPNSGDLRLEELEGKRVASMEERFKTLNSNYSPDYFIIVWDYLYSGEQEKLRGFLADKYSVVAQGDYYIIFDLKKAESHSGVR